MESISSAIVADWEFNNRLESNIRIHTFADGLVRDLEHVVDLSLTVSFTRGLAHLFL
jgi:hypothetical protein